MSQNQPNLTFAQWCADNRQFASESTRSKRRRYHMQQKPPLTPEAVLPDSNRTEKRVVRAAVKEALQSKPATEPAVAKPEPVYRTGKQPKPIADTHWREGWKDGRTWDYWNRQSEFYYASASDTGTETDVQE
jgi:hypothetical protein